MLWWFAEAQADQQYLSALIVVEKMAMTYFVVFVLVVGALSSTARTQAIGDSEKGLKYALEVCAECHSVRPEHPLSRVPEATPFEIVANTPGITSNALAAWLQTSHPSMPNIMMTDEQMRDVIEYILSLKLK
jgi:mono/diheme cytochrome c family protein